MNMNSNADGDFSYLHVGSWDVAGLGESDIDDFISQISDHYPWDVVMLQEAFTRAEGISTNSGHMVFPCQSTAGGLRGPAILIHEQWRRGAEVRFAGSGHRWVAIEMNGVMFVSLHLPTRRSPIMYYIEVLEDVQTFLAGVPI